MTYVRVDLFDPAGDYAKTTDTSISDTKKYYEKIGDDYFEVKAPAVADIVRTALLEFPKQYIIAGQVCGMDTNAIFKKIQFPIIFRQILPSLLTTQVNMLQLTLFASLISVGEIFRAAQDVNSVIYKPVEIYSALALFFLVICLPLNGLALWLKKQYTRNLSEK